jgi:CDP-paratose 2-epimerase
VAAYRAVLSRIGEVSGRAFNLGGGPQNAVSLLEVLREIGRILRRDVPVSFANIRTGDQLYFVADTRSISSALGWKARMDWRDGLHDLAEWLIEHRFGGLRGEQRRQVA